MVRWLDYIFDSKLGPTLSTCEEDAWVISDERCRKAEPEDSSVMEDANGKIQETRQAIVPARMVGLSSLDSITLDKEVDREFQVSIRQEGGVR